MATLIRRRYGRLGLQLALAFVFVAVGGVVAANAIAALTVYADARQLVDRQEANETGAAALGAGATYPPARTRAPAGTRSPARTPADMRANWARALGPLIAVADRSGTAMQVRDLTGRIVRSSPGYASFPPGPIRTALVRAGGRRVGSVTLKFDDRGVGAIVSHFEAQRWKARLSAAGFGTLFGLVVAFFLAPMIAAPVDRLLWAVRARGSGHRHARVGKVRGFRDIRELAATFDQMADDIGQQDQLRRDFVADTTHELRTPITVLRAITEAMLDGVTELTADQVESLNDEAVRLGRMVDDLQRLASAEAAAVQLTLSPCDLAALAAAVADSLANIFDNAGIRLVRRLTVVHARCDRSRMREVITNLLTNAAKFTPSGGQVVVETRPSGDQAILRVSDTGVGIPADELPHVPRRFYRGRSTGEVSGSGIGLAIVDELVRGHQGRMAIASEPGQGTQVMIELPRTDATWPAPPLGQHVRGEGERAGQKQNEHLDRHEHPERAPGQAAAPDHDRRERDERHAGVRRSHDRPEGYRRDARGQHQCPDGEFMADAQQRPDREHQEHSAEDTVPDVPGEDARHQLRWLAEQVPCDRQREQRKGLALLVPAVVLGEVGRERRSGPYPQEDSQAADAERGQQRRDGAAACGRVAPAQASQLRRGGGDADRDEDQGDRLDGGGEPGQQARGQPALRAQREQAADRERNREALGVRHREHDGSGEQAEDQHRAPGRLLTPPCGGQPLDEHRGGQTPRDRDDQRRLRHRHGAHPGHCPDDEGVEREEPERGLRVQGRGGVSVFRQPQIPPAVEQEGVLRERVVGDHRRRAGHGQQEQAGRAVHRDRPSSRPERGREPVTGTLPAVRGRVGEQVEVGRPGLVGSGLEGVWLDCIPRPGLHSVRSFVAGFAGRAASDGIPRAPGGRPQARKCRCGCCD